MFPSLKTGGTFVIPQPIECSGRDAAFFQDRVIKGRIVSPWLSLLGHELQEPELLKRKTEMPELCSCFSPAVGVSQPSARLMSEV